MFGYPNNLAFRKVRRIFNIGGFFFGLISKTLSKPFICVNEDGGGDITQERMDQHLDKAEEHINAVLNSERPWGMHKGKNRSHGRDPNKILK